jgi:hypothetical protein
MDKNVKVLRGTIEKLLPYHEYIYNKESGIISARWTDNGETVNYKIKVPEKLQRYCKNHYPDDVLTGYIMGYNKARFDMNDK